MENEKQIGGVVRVYESVNRKPKRSDLSTLERLEASRNKKPTKFHPDWIKEYKTVRYLKCKQVATNEVVKSEIFDNIILVKQVKGIIHAVGYIGLEPYFLTMEKTAQP